jgi:hypothetical protein
VTRLPGFTSFRLPQAQRNSIGLDRSFGALMKNAALPVSNPLPAISRPAASGATTKQAFSGVQTVAFYVTATTLAAMNFRSRSPGNGPQEVRRTGPEGPLGSAPDETEVEVSHPSLAPRLRHFGERIRCGLQNGIFRGSFCIPFRIPFCWGEG